MTSKTKPTSTGNVFKDLVVLGRGDVEAATLIVKLAQRISKKELAIETVASSLGVELQTLGALLSGQRKGFSVSRLRQLIDDLERAFPSKKKARSGQPNAAPRAPGVATRVATTTADSGGLLGSGEEQSTG